jgi:hypothetical protein
VSSEKNLKINEYTGTKIILNENIDLEEHATQCTMYMQHHSKGWIPPDCPIWFLRRDLGRRSGT